jgi:hypothetical protein
MFKKIAIGLLALTVFGAGSAAMVYKAITVEPVSAAEEVLMQGQAHGNDAAGQGQQSQQGVPQGNQEMVAEGSHGEPWIETGVIVTIEDAGFEMTLENGETAFVELGPPTYWTTQGITLEVGQSISVDGSIDEGMIHATAVTTSDGQVLQVRSESGQPLWSGGASNKQGQNGNSEHSGEGQFQVDEWITIEGILMSFQGGNMTMSTSEGEILSFKTGQPRFFANQGTTFQVGDEIIVVGFYQGEEFQAGDITQVSTGLRVMLRDPNGRPLWAGPGNGGGGGNGRGNGNN